MGTSCDYLALADSLKRDGFSNRGYVAICQQGVVLVSRNDSDLAQCVVKSIDTVSERVGEQVFVLSTRDNRLFTFNGVGAEIWELLDGTRTTDDIVQAVCSRFHVRRADARRDVSLFLQHLAQRGLTDVFANLACRED